MNFFKYFDIFLLFFGLKLFTSSKIIRLINLMIRLIVISFLVLSAYPTFKKLPSTLELEYLMYQSIVMFCFLNLLLIKNQIKKIIRTIMKMLSLDESKQLIKISKVMIAFLLIYHLIDLLVNAIMSCWFESRKPLDRFKCILTTE